MAWWKIRVSSRCIFSSWYLSSWLPLSSSAGFHIPRPSSSLRSWGTPACVTRCSRCTWSRDQARNSKSLICFPAFLSNPQSQFWQMTFHLEPNQRIQTNCETKDKQTTFRDLWWGSQHLPQRNWAHLQLLLLVLWCCQIHKPEAAMLPLSKEDQSSYTYIYVCVCVLIYI